MMAKCTTSEATSNTIQNNEFTEETLLEEICDYDLSTTKFWNHSLKLRYDFDDAESADTNQKSCENVNKYDLLKSGGLDDAANTNLESDFFNKAQITEVSHIQQEPKVDVKSASIFAFNSIEKIILDQEYSFLKFKGKNEKEELLKAAVQTHDGNAILSVILYLKQTLNKSIFHQVIGKFPDAINTYLTYLEEDHEIDELINMLLLLGRNEDAAMFKYEFAISNVQPDRKIKMIENCLNTHFQYGIVDKFYIDSLQEHQQLIKEQIALEDHRLAESPDEGQTFQMFEQLTSRNRLVDSSAILTLIFCILYFPKVNEIAFISPVSVKARFNLSKKQFTWAALRALAFTQRWNEIQELFLTKNWFRGAKMKSCIGFQKVVEVLINVKAPIEVISEYINHIEDPEIKLNLAKKHECHFLVLEVLKNNKDRKGLLEYRASLPQQSLAFINASNILNMPTLKWKN